MIHVWLHGWMLLNRCAALPCMSCARQGHALILKLWSWASNLRSRLNHVLLTCSADDGVPAQAKPSCYHPPCDRRAGWRKLPGEAGLNTHKASRAHKFMSAVLPLQSHCPMVHACHCCAQGILACSSRKHSMAQGKSIFMHKHLECHSDT